MNAGGLDFEVVKIKPNTINLIHQCLDPFFTALVFILVIFVC